MMAGAKCVARERVRAMAIDPPSRCVAWRDADGTRYYLYEAFAPRADGRRFFVLTDPDTSISWLTDVEADRWIKLRTK